MDPTALPTPVVSLKGLLRGVVRRVSKLVGRDELFEKPGERPPSLRGHGPGLPAPRQDDPQGVP
jgi:hypothetical protein